jgi:hypothetical protein
LTNFLASKSAIAPDINIAFTIINPNNIPVIVRVIVALMPLLPPWLYIHQLPSNDDKGISLYNE